MENGLRIVIRANKSLVIYQIQQILLWHKLQLICLEMSQQIILCTRTCSIMCYNTLCSICEDSHLKALFLFYYLYNLSDKIFPLCFFSLSSEIASH